MPKRPPPRASSKNGEQQRRLRLNPVLFRLVPVNEPEIEDQLPIHSRDDDEDEVSLESIEVEADQYNMPSVHDLQHLSEHATESIKVPNWQDMDDEVDNEEEERPQERTSNRVSRARSRFN